jgi:hypothetical protein
MGGLFQKIGRPRAASQIIGDDFESVWLSAWECRPPNRRRFSTPRARSRGFAVRVGRPLVVANSNARDK